MEFKDHTPEEIELVMEQAWNAFLVYRNYPPGQKAAFMRAIGKAIEDLGEELIEVAKEETHLTEARLRAERARTVFQLNSYADACETASWMDIRIDRAMKEKNPPRPDLRKMMIPLGPVVVFGAANFPFAYSTAGGDTACALAAGCPVIVKAHPAHARTSELVAEAIRKVAVDLYLPAGIFSHVHGASFSVGQALVEHPRTKAVGFTGSLAGGRQLFDWAVRRKEPIPVFAEMSSINPVFLLPGKMKTSASDIASMLAASITLGVGQFCTNPGLIIAIDNDDLATCISMLSAEISRQAHGDMLNTGIFKNYVEKRANALAVGDVETLAVAEGEPQFNQATATLASATAQAFINNPLLHQEVFGPYSLIVRCRDAAEMTEVARHIEGQLTCTLMATAEDISAYTALVDLVKYTCGRFILNNVPTGVEVTLAMQHGGPYPATTDSRFTSVGADGIRRFARPITFQNWDNELLPDELKDENPLGLKRDT
jgi:NADP-dependent aldehyde dehydrogenase